MGDLLTASPTRGPAMWATDPVTAFGTVIGKRCGLRRLCKASSRPRCVAIRKTGIIIAMADPGYIDLPATAHFRFEYDNTLNQLAASAFGVALAGNAETDYNLVSFWFGGLTPPGVPFNVKINKPSATRSGGNDGNKQITIDVGANADFDLGRWVLVAELTEIFMRAQNRGWNAGKSNGEALSQVAGFTIVPSQATRLIGPPTWLDDDNSARPDFVSQTDTTDKNAVSYGCGVLFLYHLRSQLGFTMRAVVQGAADTLEGVYHNLTQDSHAFAAFSALLAARFPPGVPSTLVGSTNPFPLPSSRSLSLMRYLAANPLLQEESIGDRIRSKNVGNMRAVLNSDRPASLL